MAHKTVIIGGSAAGAAAAARLRRLSEQEEIIILEKGKDISYASCGLAYYLGGEVPLRQNLVIIPPGVFSERYRTEVKTQCEAIHISPEKKTVAVLNHQNGETEEISYDSLLIASGAAALRPEKITGITLPHIYNLRTLPDVDSIHEELPKEQSPSEIADVLVAGGGFIGIEAAENLTRKGFRVTLIELRQQLLQNLDPEFSGLLVRNLLKHGVNVKLGLGVKSFSLTLEDTVEAVFSDNSKKKFRFAVLALGIRPSTDFLEGSGIEKAANGAVITNCRMETSVPGIYAAGDNAVILKNYSNELTWSPLAGPAARGGRRAADSIARSLGILPDNAAEFTGTSGSAIIRVFDETYAFSGTSEYELKQKGLQPGQDYFTSFVIQSSHVSWYPGSQEIFIRGIFDKKRGTLIGAEAAGRKGVHEVINTLATVIALRGTFSDLANIDLAYSPQYGSAKSNINMLGFTAENQVLGLGEYLSLTAYKALDKKDYYVLDVRNREEVLKYRIPEAVNIPLAQLRERMKEIPKDRPVIVICAVGVRAWNAAGILRGNGYHSIVLEGGATLHSMLQGS
ncbi:FAD-dependent oxidoreductase [Succinimonas sp.]|uniref:FAD-dependent oxidoreductase n=1 Tax=Succinimonas sp. TaxID=1936151 RepID=UPI00386F28E0